MSLREGGFAGWWIFARLGLRGKNGSDCEVRSDNASPGLGHLSEGIFGVLEERKGGVGGRYCWNLTNQIALKTIPGQMDER